ncbi:MAG: hypothetical protein DCC71_11925 [Proteobacteria bacterium]|nr:MAG: hypothetical protein DCC71_11925 [Pseudomonadota bacterium]
MLDLAALLSLAAAALFAARGPGTSLRASRAGAAATRGASPAGPARCGLVRERSLHERGSNAAR